jgi:hypothetical protein
MPASTEAASAAARPWDTSYEWKAVTLLGFGFGLVGLDRWIISPVGLASSAIGIVVGSGEIFGGGVAPSIAGFMAQNYGIHTVLLVALVDVMVGFVVCFFLKETAPRKSALKELGSNA